jgi:hypothetical protein
MVQCFGPSWRTHMKSLSSISLLAASALLTSSNAVFAFKFVTKDADGTTHVSAPFVHVDVSPEDQTGKHVKVNAPFTHVDNRPGIDKPSVRAPFTRVQKDAATNTTNVKAPFVKVNNPPGPNNASVSAPFTKVTHDNQTKKTSIKAPFTNIERPEKDEGGTKSATTNSSSN